MTKRPTSLISASAVAVLTVSTAAAMIGAAGPAAAAKPKPKPHVWTQLSSHAGINISYQPSVARFGSKLLVVWPQGNGAINARILGSDGKPVGSISSVVAGWSEVTTDPRAFTLAGKPSVAFSGAHSNVTQDPLNGPILYAQSATGATWAQAPGSLSHDVDTSNGYGLGAVDDGHGQPLVTVAGSSTNHLTVHNGVDAAVPAAGLDGQSANFGQTVDVSLARDRVSGIAYAAFYSGLNDASMGIHAAEVYPGIGGESAAAPMSVVRYGGKPISSDPNQNVALAARVGGGVWAAYGSGYPDPHKLVLWNLETGRTLTLSRPNAEVQYVSLSAAPGGRLWVSWIEGGKVLATRTNPSVTKFGVIRSLTAPGGYSATRNTGDGSLGPLDAVINDSVNGAPSQVFSAHIYEGLRVTASAGAGGKVGATVTDAGVPVKGVYVKIGGAVARTNASGKATITLSKRTAKGTHTVTAYGTGWWPGGTSVKVS